MLSFFEYGIFKMSCFKVLSQFAGHGVMYGRFLSPFITNIIMLRLASIITVFDSIYRSSKIKSKKSPP